MYNKGLNCRSKHSGRQGRTKNKLKFPRHIINRYEGTHLGIHPVNTWSEYKWTWPNMKHVRGLLNKFVGKPYNKFLNVWHAKLKHVNSRIKNTFDLKRVIDSEPMTHMMYSVSYYIDNNELIQKYKVERRHRYRYELTKHQRRYNDNVKIPNLGVCKNSSPYNYEFLNYHSKQDPIMLGEFYVPINNTTIKIPVYTCCSNLMIDYHGARDVNEYVKDKDFKVEQKKRNLTELWVPIKSNPWFGNPISLNLDHQYVFVEVPNKRREMAIKEYYIATSLGETEKVEELRTKIARMPRTVNVNVGYGDFFLFVKRKDIEKAKDKK